MRSILFLILFIAEGWFISISAQDSEQRILEQLDKAISQKEKFKNDREAVISQIKQRLNYATDNTERYKLCGELFNLYLHYQADSACHYIRRKEYYNSLQPQPERDIEISINRAEVRGVMGMYNEALTELQTIHPHELSSPNLEYYYFTIRACYGWMADNTVDLHVKQTYLKNIIRKTKCFDFWERNVLFPKTKRSFFRTPKHPLPCPFPLNFSLLIITKKFGNLAKNRYICIV